MADRTVRAIFDAKVDAAKKNIKGFGKDVADTGKKVDGLTKDLKDLDGQKVKPDIDLQIDEAKKRLSTLTGDLADLKAMEASPEVDLQIEQAKAQIKDVRSEIKDLTSQKYEVRVDAQIKDAKKRVEEITRELGDLRTQEVTPEVQVEIKEAQKRLRDAKAEVRDLNAAKATVKVDADTRQAKAALDGVADDAATAGEEGGDEAGENLVGGILGSLKTIPIAGAVVGVGVAIGVGLLAGIKDGLQVEAGRDLFSARTGMDEATSARFGRAAGEAYAQGWGESVEANLDTASRALRAGIIDSDATDAEIENVVAKLQGIQDLFEYDIPMSVQGVGNLMKTGLVKDADEAFDLIVASSQKIPSDDLIETVNEYSNQFAGLGITAEQAFGMIVQGAEAGARDTDKVADTIKEMGIRIGEGLEPATDALDKLGLDADEIVSAFQEGGPRAQDAIGLVFDALRKVEDQGGNTQEIVAALFGGPGEDLGAALYALDINKVEKALGGVDGAAGAADKALETMADNAAMDIEMAKRNIETAADGIKGALAAAFSDDISSAADWVSRNREAMIQFFLDVVEGATMMGISFSENAATTLDSIAAMADGMSSFLLAIPGMEEAGHSLGAFAEEARKGADALRDEVPAALEETNAKVQEWAAPELMKARIHDAQMAMSEDMDTFSAKVDESGGTVKINGNKVNAEETLSILKKNINKEDGTVTINGDRVPAENVLDVLMGHVRNSKGDIKVGGDTSSGRSAVRGLVADTGTRRASISVDANTAAAEAAIAYAARKRYVDLGVRVSGSTGAGGLARYHGGIVGGRYSGGKVPGADVGYDNVLWPLNSGGKTLTQPLGGGEMVVTASQTALWEPLLQAINAGLKPGDLRGGTSSTYTTTAHIEHLHGVSLDAAMREADEIRRRENLSRRNT